MGTPRKGARLPAAIRRHARVRFRATTHTEREKERESEEKSNYNSLCIVGVIIGARASIMEVQRRLRIGRRSLDGVREEERTEGGRAGFAGAGKRMKRKTKGDGGTGEKEKEKKREREP